MTLSAQTASTHCVAARTVDVIPTGAALGAEVRAVDLRDLDEGIRERDAAVARPFGAAVP
jgi:hypothetical protein